MTKKNKIEPLVLNFLKKDRKKMFEAILDWIDDKPERLEELYNYTKGKKPKQKKEKIKKVKSNKDTIKKLTKKLRKKHIKSELMEVLKCINIGKMDECWESRRESIKIGNKNQTIKRWIYEFFINEIPEKHYIRNKYAKRPDDDNFRCKYPSCPNPRHLWAEHNPKAKFKDK